MDFNPTLQKHDMNTPNISRICYERVHTTPESMSDNYGLYENLSSKNHLKNSENINLSRRIDEKKQALKPITRFHT